jgi:hypothetical protein
MLSALLSAIAAEKRDMMEMIINGFRKTGIRKQR